MGRKTTLMQLVEQRHGEPIDQLLSRLYWQEGQTLATIAQQLGTTESCVYKWMVRLGIPVRPWPPAKSARTA